MFDRLGQRYARLRFFTNPIPVGIDIALDLTQHGCLALGLEEMPKSSLRFQVLLDRPKVVGNQGVTDDTVDRLLQGPNARFDR